MTIANLTPADLAAIEQIAKEHVPGLETLETRNSDSLDFHDIAVWSLRRALAAAFEAGKAQGGQTND